MSSDLLRWSILSGLSDSNFVKRKCTLRTKPFNINSIKWDVHRKVYISHMSSFWSYVLITFIICWTSFWLAPCVCDRAWNVYNLCLKAVSINVRFTRAGEAFIVFDARHDRVSRFSKLDPPVTAKRLQFLGFTAAFYSQSDGGST
jgi:hypothetical protein